MAFGQQWLQRFRQWLDAPVEVPLVCELAADYVAALRHRHGQVEAWAVEPLPAGALAPSPLAENLPDPTPIQTVLERVLERVRDGEARAGLILPDLVARVLFLEFDQFPGRREEAQDLLRWRLSKDLPFDSRQAVLSYRVQPGREAGVEVLVAACLRDVLRRYEERLEAAGLEPGQVTLATLAAAGWLPASDSTPRLLVKSEPAALGLAILREGQVRLFRSVPLSAVGSITEEALFEKIYPAVVHFQDHWGEPVAETLVAGMNPLNSALGRQLNRETGSLVTELNPARFEVPPSPSTGAGPDGRLAACLGWLRGEGG